MEHTKDWSWKNEPHIKADHQRGDADAEDPREFAEKVKVFFFLFHKKDLL
ncbi:hypothetical protein JQM64_01420 [Fournierella massiliensis]|nr:hypothetical protein [Fournierella massiliensis]MCF2556205.1 hypothetical protein [Fournierella massiliensis]